MFLSCHIFFPNAAIVDQLCVLADFLATPAHFLAFFLALAYLQLSSSVKQTLSRHLDNGTTEMLEEMDGEIIASLNLKQEKFYEARKVRVEENN